MNNKLKKTLIPLFNSAQKTAFFCAALHLCPAFAAQNLYFDTAYVPETGENLTAADNWYVDSARTELFSGTLGADYNGIINSRGDLYISKGDSGTLELNSLSFILSDVGSTSIIPDMMVIWNGGIRLVEDFNFDITVSPSSAAAASNYIRLVGNKTVNVGGNLNINYNQNGGSNYTLSIFCKDTSGNPTAMNIGGDINVVSADGSPFRLRFGLTNMEVGGVMHIGNTIWTVTTVESSTNQGYMSRVIGGLDSGGEIGVMMASKIGGIEFRNSGICEWAGTFSSGRNDDAKGDIDITMNANSVNGRQTLRFTGKAYGVATNLNNVAINNGRLDLGMYSGMKGNRLSLIGSGGTFSPTGIGGGDIGTVTFAEGEWYAGKIALDIEGEASYDKIAFEGNLEKTGNNISLELSFDEYTIAELIGASGEDEFVLSDMITYAAGSSIEGTVLVGSSGKIRWEATFGETSMNVAFSAIPEPSEIAAVFGTIALALAVRRRKGN